MLSNLVKRYAPHETLGVGVKYLYWEGGSPSHPLRDTHTVSICSVYTLYWRFEFILRD